MSSVEMPLLLNKIKRYSRGMSDCTFVLIQGLAHLDLGDRKNKDDEGEKDNEGDRHNNHQRIEAPAQHNIDACFPSLHKCPCLMI